MSQEEEGEGGGGNQVHLGLPCGRQKTYQLYKAYILGKERFKVFGQFLYK